jgi:hypothetical protein
VRIFAFIGGVVVGLVCISVIRCVLAMLWRAGRDTWRCCRLRDGYSRWNLAWCVPSMFGVMLKEQLKAWWVGYEVEHYSS